MKEINEMTPEELIETLREAFWARKVNYLETFINAAMILDSLSPEFITDAIILKLEGDLEDELIDEHLLEDAKLTLSTMKDLQCSLELKNYQVVYRVEHCLKPMN